MSKTKRKKAMAFKRERVPNDQDSRQTGFVRATPARYLVSM